MARRTERSLRRNVLALLAEGDATPIAIAMTLALPVEEVETLLQELQDAGMVEGNDLH